MANNFFSGLFRGSASGSRHVECHAEDPNNCRFHHTGKYSDAGKRAEEAERIDAMTPAEKENLRIQASHKVSAKNPGKMDLSCLYGKHLRTSHQPLNVPSNFQQSHFGGIWNMSEYTPPAAHKIRTVKEIEQAIEDAKPDNLKAVRKLGTYTDGDGKKHETRISAVTGKPISRECNAIIDALMCGVPVFDYEIEAMPEWKDAQKRYADYASSLAKDKSPANSWADISAGREKVRKSVYDKMSDPIITHETNHSLKDGESYKVAKGFRFDIVTGLPAGGKNYTFADRLSRENKARLADADIVKSLLPGYADGLGSNIVHDESTFINKDLIDDTFKKDDPKFGDNIVYPTLGGSSPKLIDFIEQAHDAGYTVHLHLNEISREKAKGRMLYRMIQTGRYLPLSVFTMTHDAVKAYEEAKDYADTAEWYRSDAGEGIEPKKISDQKNDKPKRRPKVSQPNYSQYGLFGYLGSASGLSPTDYDDGIDLESVLGGNGDDDIPAWLDDDDFWNDPVNYRDNYNPKKEVHKDSVKRSGMSIEDILAGKGKK